MIRTVNDLKNRKLDKFYVAVYLVTYPVPVKKDMCTESTELCILYGVTPEGKRKIIDVFLEKVHDNRFWLEKFEHIKSRGLEKILFLLTKADKNIDRALKILYNETIIIESPIEIIMPLRKYLTFHRDDDVFRKFRKILLADSTEAYDTELQLLKEDIKEYTVTTMLLEKITPKIFNFQQYNKEIRHMLLPYYAIREMQSQIRKITKINECFNNTDEIIFALIGYINSFDVGISYRRKDWLKIMNVVYANYTKEIEGYI
jgi:transposase-like protein